MCKVGQFSLDFNARYVWMKRVSFVWSRKSLGCDTCFSSTCTLSIQVVSGIILYMRPANERWRYNVALYLIGLVHIKNDPLTTDSTASIVSANRACELANMFWCAIPMECKFCVCVDVCLFIQYFARNRPWYSLRGLHIRMTWFSLYGIHMPLFFLYGIHKPLFPYIW